MKNSFELGIRSLALTTAIASGNLAIAKADDFSNLPSIPVTPILSVPSASASELAVSQANATMQAGVNEMSSMLDRDFHGHSERTYKMRSVLGGQVIERLVTVPFISSASGSAAISQNSGYEMATYTTSSNPTLPFEVKLLATNKIGEENVYTYVKDGQNWTFSEVYPNKSTTLKSTIAAVKPTSNLEVPLTGDYGDYANDATLAGINLIEAAKNPKNPVTLTSEVL